MISRCIHYTVLTFRNVYLQMNCKIKGKLHPRHDIKLFQLALLSSNRRKSTPLKKPVKNLRDKKPIKVWENMTAEELASAMNIDFSVLNYHYPLFKLSPQTQIKSLFAFTFLAHKLGWKFEIVKERKAEENRNKFIVKQPPSKPENLVKRPPVVTVMGHVDHGKTTLLDSLRNTFVTQQEFGGITQHIGAFSVEVKPGEKITFIDTPGHAAFTVLRTRGAQVTDIVVLVIAADDGVMQQTVESIKIAKAAEVQIIIAVNKIDKPTALPIDDIKKKLLLEGVQVEDQGGSIQLVAISALKKLNLDLLTEVILLEAELMNLKGDPTGLVEGVILESKNEKMGIAATLIIKRGTLQKKKIIVAGFAHARVRKMLDENGKEFNEATPSTAVQVFGWKELPEAGDVVLEVSSEKEAIKLIRERENDMILEKQKSDQHIIREKLSKHQEEHHANKEFFNAISNIKERRRIFFEQKKLQEKKEGETEEIGPCLNVILKGDVYGSLEVLEGILLTYDKHEECKLNIIQSSIGDIIQKDVEMAEVSNSIIYAFNVNLHQTLKNWIKNKNIDIRYYNVIYKLIDDLKEELDKRIPPEDQEKIIGEAEVIQSFRITYASKKVHVAGAKCKQGQLTKENLYKVLRNDELIYRGTLIEMKHEKKVVKVIPKGLECGLMLDSFPDKFLPGDKIICYEMIKVPKKSGWSPGF